jgi:hypothetical protein
MYKHCTYAYIYRLFLLCIFLQLGSILSSKIALLVIDVQNCFLPGGSLAVTEGDHVIPVINDIRSKFDSSIISANKRKQESLKCLIVKFECPIK